MIYSTSLIASWLCGLGLLAAACCFPLFLPGEISVLTWQLLFVYQMGWAVIESFLCLAYRSPAEPVPGGSNLFPNLQASTTILTVIWVFGVGSQSAISSHWLPVIGILIGAFGLGLRGWGIASLKGGFRDTVDWAAEHHIVQTGPYRWMRHPGETGFLLLMLGLCITAGGHGLLLFGSTVLPLSVARMVLENRMMAQPSAGSDRSQSVLPGLPRLSKSDLLALLARED